MGRMTLVEKPLPRAISLATCACSIPRGEDSPLKVKKIEVTAKPKSSTKKIERRMMLAVSDELLSFEGEVLMCWLMNKGEGYYCKQARLSARGLLIFSGACGG
jgi:hypothetical protein